MLRCGLVRETRTKAEGFAAKWADGRSQQLE